MRVIVFAPHPDDDVIGCGGSIVKFVRAGAEVSVCYLTSGDGGVRGVGREAAALLRETEAKRAAGELGVHHLHFLRRPDGLLRESVELLVDLVNLIRRERADVAYLPHASDDHPDHVQTHHIALKALRRAAGPWLPEAEGREWRTPTIVAYEVWTPIQRPTYIEDTTAEFPVQLSALTMHESQLADIAYDDMLRGLAAFRGSTLGSGRMAEAFEVIRLPALSLMQGP